MPATNVGKSTRAVLEAAGSDFIRFALSHAGCGEAVIEHRLDDLSIASWCGRCGELRVFTMPERVHPGLPENDKEGDH